MIFIDHKKYFTEHRKVFGVLNDKQVAGITAKLRGMAVDRPLVDIRHAAYMFATAWHETAATMQPIREFGRGRGKRYGKPGRNGGQIPYGRGDVQLTWDENYERADRQLGLSGALIADYDLALDPEISYRIMSGGMLEGWFTGKKLSDYILGERCNYLSARRIINGTDRAAMIAGYGRSFESILRKSEEVLTIDEPVQKSRSALSAQSRKGPFNG
jgi:putative chitinase